MMISANLLLPASVIGWHVCLHFAEEDDGSMNDNEANTAERIFQLLDTEGNSALGLAEVRTFVTATIASGPSTSSPR